MITLGELKTFFAAGSVNQSLLSSSSLMGSIVHWVATDILGTADFWWNQGNDQFDTVADQAQYFLSNKVSDDKIWGMYDQDNDRKIFKSDLKYFYDFDATPTDTGNQALWAYVGQASCQAVPTDAGVISITSSSSLDEKNVIVRGKSSGIEMYEILQLSGTATITGTISWDADLPISVNVEAQCLGLVTATRGIIVAQIPPGHLRVQRTGIQLLPIPATTGDTIKYFFYKRSLPLVSDYEIVDLPDIAFKALRYGVEEITYYLVGKLAASESAFKKYNDAMIRLVSVSERDIAGNLIKDCKPTIPFKYRLPDTIDGSVI